MNAIYLMLSCAAFFMTGLVSGCYPSSNVTDICSIVAKNDVSSLQKWIEEGGDPNYISRHGESLLYIATGPNGGIEVVSLLIEAGANVDSGSGHYTPLMNAASWCDVPTVLLLLEHGADPTKENSRGDTAHECVGLCKGDHELKRVLSDAVQNWKQ